MRVGTLPMHNPDLHLDSGCIVRNHVNGQRYRIQNFLGSGGFGAAYEIVGLGNRLPDGKRHYCLKVTANPESWCREAYFGDLLRNVAGVLQVYEAFAWVPHPRNQRPLYCLISELADGGDLASWLERNPEAWKERRAQREIIKLLRTIRCLHERGAVLVRERTFSASMILIARSRAISKYRLRSSREPCDSQPPRRFTNSRWGASRKPNAGSTSCDLQFFCITRAEILGLTQAEEKEPL